MRYNESTDLARRPNWILRAVDRGADGRLPRGWGSPSWPRSRGGDRRRSVCRRLFISGGGV